MDRWVVEEVKCKMTLGFDRYDCSAIVADKVLNETRLALNN